MTTATINEMVRLVIDDIPVLEELKLSECSIYEVPCNLRKVNQEAYTPQLISIGPAHFGKEELKPMQENKLRYFHFFWKHVSNEQAMKNYKHHLETKEQEIRQCYAHKFTDNINKEKFVAMMLLDAVFIMELFLRNRYWKSGRSEHEHDNVATRSFIMKHRKDDYILTQPWLSIDIISRDLILLENQIPFFVLNDLYDIVFPGDKEKHTSFHDLALEYFEFYDTQRSIGGTLVGSKKPLDENKDKCKRPKHFTDLIRVLYIPSPTDQLGRWGWPKSLRTATKLQEAGVSFEKVLKRRLLDITFDKTPFLSSFLCLSCIPCLNHCKAWFRIPQLKVTNTTECVLRNLIAFEQCHYPEQPYICNYVSLIDSLIHTQVDVELLVEKDVIVHQLGSDKEVATLVNGLGKHVVTNTTCYYKIINELDGHYRNPWNRPMAALWLVYFRDPWRASSTVVGIAVFFFAVFNFLRILRYFL